jgi:hypothetical protein
MRNYGNIQCSTQHHNHYLFDQLVVAMAPSKKIVLKTALKFSKQKSNSRKGNSINQDAESTKSASTVKKRPATLNKKNLASLEQDPQSVTESLNEKIALFEKKPTDINTWLSKLSKQEREACWKRFEYDRKATPGAEDGYQMAATGKRSMSVKLDLLKTFLLNKSSCKGSAMQQAFLSYGVTIGQKSKESWRPFVYMSNYYGVAELLRRVQDGSILARKDGNEWEFKLVQRTSYKDEHNAGGHHAQAQGKLQDEKWADLQAAASQLNLNNEPGNQDSGVIRFLQDKASSSSKKLTDANRDSNSQDEDIQAADKLSDLGTIGKKAKERVVSALALLQKVSSETTDPDYKVLLGNHIKVLKKLDGPVKVEDVKDKLIKAMQCVKKAKST